MLGKTTLSNLCTLRDYQSRRVSSYAQDGSNSDSWRIEPHVEVTLAHIKGPGCIKHIWMTMGIPQEDYTRRVVLRIYWNGAAFPSVECPIGDFFGIGHGIRKNFWSLPLQMSPQDGKAFNSWWNMPFSEEARITVLNEGDQPYNQYFYIDYESYEEAPRRLAYFHCQWRRENPTKGWGDDDPRSEVRDDEWRRIFWVEAKNTSGADNYVILDTQGDGIYVGCHLDIDCFQPQMNKWYGEGDDMIFVDGEPWPPSLHGTGTEDYFNTAYCPRQEFCTPYYGIPVYSGTSDWPFKGKNTLYRYHIEDPIRFRKSIKVTIEHGHANKLSNDYSSTAYYYLSAPAPAGPPLVSVAERLPRPNEPVYSVKKRVDE
jgi:hypothetical protein